STRPDAGTFATSSGSGQTSPPSESRRVGRGAASGHPQPRCRGPTQNTPCVSLDPQVPLPVTPQMRGPRARWGDYPPTEGPTVGKRVKCQRNSTTAGPVWSPDARLHGNVTVRPAAV